VPYRVLINSFTDLRKEGGWEHMKVCKLSFRREEDYFEADYEEALDAELISTEEFGFMMGYLGKI